MTGALFTRDAKSVTLDRPPIPELAVVRVTRDVEADGRVLPRASSGTVVGVYAGGRGYEVEFERPFHAVVTLDLADLAE